MFSKTGYEMEFIDLTGKKYGDWKILQKEPNFKKKVQWLCQCKCGKKKVMSSQIILGSQARKNCGCIQDWTGRRFSNLTVLKKIGDRTNYDSKILCLCDCGNEIIRTGSSLGTGRAKSCGCIKKAKGKLRGVTSLFGSYQLKCEKKKICFSLSKERFKELINISCFYCKTAPKNSLILRNKTEGNKNFIYNGLDRMDNSKGYTDENVVPCCKKCNLMKKDMSIEEWLSQMRLILENFPK